MAEVKRYKLRLEYDGTDFAGWQLQSNVRSVQGELERAVGSLLQQSLRVHGAGRTDTGVHASGMVAHFEAATTMQVQELRKGLNALLPADIAVSTVEIAEPDFHSRFSASSREYMYNIILKKKAMHRQYAWLLYSRINAEAIQECIPLLLGTHDFKGFSKKTEKLDHAYCHVFRAEWLVNGDEHCFIIKANRFLYGMVRCLVGGLVLVGRGKMTKDRFAEILASKNHDEAPMLAPAHGLTLTDVAYDAEERNIIGNIIKSLRVQLAEEQLSE